MRRRGLLAALALLPAAPALALDPVPGPDSAIVAQIEAAVLGFRDYYRRWPANVPELHGFAQQTRRPLDLSRFANLGLRVASPQTVYIDYVTTSGERGGFAIAVREVIGRRR